MPIVDAVQIPMIGAAKDLLLSPFGKIHRRHKSNGQFQTSKGYAISIVFAFRKTGHLLMQNPRGGVVARKLWEKLGRNSFTDPSRPWADKDSDH